MDATTIITLGGVQVPMLEGWIWPAVILGHMVVVIRRAQRRSWTRTTSSSRKIVHDQQRELVIVHGLVTLFLGVIALAIILLVVGLCALRVLVISLRAIVALIISMTIVGSAIIVVVSVTFSWEPQPPCWSLDTAQRKQSSWASW